MRLMPDLIFTPGGPVLPSCEGALVNDPISGRCVPSRGVSRKCPEGQSYDTAHPWAVEALNRALRWSTSLKVEPAAAAKRNRWGISRVATTPRTRRLDPAGR